MRALSGTKAPELKADPIIHHPSVRTMLLTQKAVAEGGRSMVYECAKLVDKMDLCEAAGDAKGAKAIDERLAFLTPILKGFLTEVGKEAADLGIQAYGGHGYIKDNKAEQVFRDVRIAALWEGTTQIQVREASTAFHAVTPVYPIAFPLPPPPWQALDLLGRKIMLQKLAPIKTATKRLREQCAPHLFAGGQLGKHSRALWFKAWEWQYLTYRIAYKAGSESKEYISSASVDFLMYSGYVTLASHWLKMEAAATAALAKPADATEEPDFYKAKIQTSAFVFDRLLPRCASHKEIMLAPVSSSTDLAPGDFSFDHSR